MIYDFNIATYYAEIAKVMHQVVKYISDKLKHTPDSKESMSFK